MIVLICGLMIFLGVHSIHLFANEWRGVMVDKMGLLLWKGIFALFSLLGFALIVLGYAEARQAPILLWVSPVWLRHLSGLLVLIALVLLMATYVPGTKMKAKLGHPMLAATKIWAFAHLLSNGTLADILLFGSFLAWSIVGFSVCRRRDRSLGLRPAATGLGRDLTAVILGVVVWLWLVFQGHGLLIGVSPI